MFGIFKKKPTALDGVIRAIYGDHPPKKSADLERAVTIAHEDILCELVNLSEVRNVASGLFASPIPYSTHDLAVAVALSFFKKPEHRNSLKDVQLAARLRVLNWTKDGKVARGVTTIFEETLYTTYKPGPPPLPGPPPVPPPLTEPGPPPVPQDGPTAVQDAKFASFQKQHAGETLEDAAQIVHEFMLSQFNIAEHEKPDDWEWDGGQQDRAERIERAFWFGAARLADEAFSYFDTDDDDDRLLKHVLRLFHGLDETAAEYEKVLDAINVEDQAMWGGRQAMMDYLLNERKDEELRELADQQKVCWTPVQIQDLALKTQRKLQEEFAAVGIDFMQQSWPRLFGQRPAGFKWIPAGLC
ncbi:hypothetical protein ACVME5_001379 [Bradyrhizobium liaoningense]